jgi:hypothetical protein
VDAGDQPLVLPGEQSLEGLSPGRVHRAVTVEAR